MAEYIERDKAIEKINAYCELRQAICINDKDEFLRGLQTALKAISYNDVIPNADIQPVKRGRWIDIYEWAEMHDSRPSGMCTYYWCSECEKEQEKKSDFCPNCGARMDGGAENG